MADFLSPDKRSKVMASIRARGNQSTEKRLVSIFRDHRITGWRRHQPLPGRPDFIFRKERLAVFVDGCFWHGCRWHCRMPKSRQAFWDAKIARNKLRAKEVNKKLKSMGWRVCRIWEHSLASSSVVIARLRRYLNLTQSESANG